MRILQGKVIGGQIVLEGEIPQEGASVTILVQDGEQFTLNEAEEAELLEAIAEADAGDLVSAEELLRELSARHGTSH